MGGGASVVSVVKRTEEIHRDWLESCSGLSVLFERNSEGGFDSRFASKNHVYDTGDGISLID